MKYLFFLCFLFASFIANAQNKSSLLEKSFLNPPDSIRTGVYWYWMSDNISKEGVVADLKAMKKAGINLAFIGNIGPSTHHNQNYPYGKVKFMSDEWWEVIHTALKTATELNIEIGIFNSPGWSQSGGPWIKPEQSMRYLASKEIQVSGGRKISVKLLPPTNHFQDLKTIAFPTARKNLLDDSYRNITVSDSLPIVISFSKNETVRGIMLYPDKYLNAKCAFQVKDGNGYRTVKEFSLDRDVTIDIQRGYDQLSPIVESLTETTGKEFRLIFKNAKPKSIISSLVLTSSPLVNHYPENIYAKFPTTIPPFFPSAGETNYPSVSESEGAVNPEKVLDISQYLSGDGTLNWTVPAGEWTIMRLGMTTTTIKNTPASPEATGLEVDKINKKHIQAHFESFLGEIYRRIPAEDRRSWKYTVMDSWEKASQNITDGMLEKFQQRYGYDPTPYLPAYYGYVVGNHELTERFLWDLHRFIADAMAYEYVAGLREISHQYKLKTWLENYGHYGFTGEFLQYGGQSDEVAGEFWNDQHVSEKRAAASAAHIYGKSRAWAESFTGGKGESHYQRYPGMLKGYGDLAFATGINSMIYHVYIQQYDNDEYPGVDAWFSTEFNRKNTWFSQLDLFVDYTKRASYMLQQGLNVADVAYYIGEDVPIMTGEMKPALPKGYYFDFINSEVLINSLEVKNGRLVLPHGVSYSVLVLPNNKTMRPEVLRKIEKLVAEGATIIGPLPERSPSLQNYPQADRDVQALSEKLKNKIPANNNLEEVFATLNIPPDFGLDKSVPVLYQHRALANGTDIYFITNQSNKAIKFNARFRVSGKQPELWDAVSGATRTLPEFADNGKITAVPLQLEAYESAFVVFQKTVKHSAYRLKANFPIPVVVAEITNSWKIKFESDSIKRGPAGTVTFNQLEDWTKSEDARIKYYSGQAVYENSITLNKLPKGNLYLDLGYVGMMAKIKINGRYVGGVWTAPYRVDITGAIKKGENKIEVEVVNTWINRILGDMRLPVNERKLTPHTAPWTADTPLEKSGLLGPVKIVSIN